MRLRWVGICLLSLLPESVTFGKDKIPIRPGVVRHVGDSKRGPYVVIDLGSLQGYVIGMNVCLYNDLGQETGCGVIEHTNPRSAGIRLPTNKEVIVSEGNRAWSMTWGTLPVVDGYAAEDNDDVEELIEDQEEAEPEEPSTLTRRISYQYVSMIALPVSANNLQFDATARATGTGSVWTSGEVLKKSLLGFAVSFRMPKPGSWDNGFHLGYQFMQQSRVKTDYDLTDSNQKVESGVSAHLYRLGYSRGYAIVQGEGFDWMASLGFDAWLVNHKFRAEHTDSSSLAIGAIYNGLATMPVSTWTEILLGGWTITTGVEVQIPIFMRGNRVTGQVGYSEETTANKDISAIGTAINPRKSTGYGAKIGIGAKI